MRVELANRAASSLGVRDLLDRAKATELSDPTASRVLVQQARVLAHGENDDASEAEAFYRLASLAYYTGQTDEAFSVAVDALDLANRCGATVVAVWALNLMGIVHFNAGNYSEALSCCLGAVEQYRTTDHAIDEGNLLNTIGTIHHALGDIDRAIVTYEAALAANRSRSRPDLDALTLTNMAQLRAERREFFLAASLGESALELSRAHAPQIIPEVLGNLGEAYANLSDPKRSAAAFDEALSILEDRAARGATGQPTAAISVRTARGRAAMISGDLVTAEQDLLVALDLAERDKARRAQMTAHELLIKVYRRLERYEDALDHQDARFALHQTLFNQGDDLRIKALEIENDTATGRRQIEVLTGRVDDLVGRLGARTDELDTFRVEAFRRLAVLAEYRDTDTGDHSLRVGDLAAEIAEAMGLDAAWREDLRMAARLHDIGKIAVPDAILFKAGPLDSDEAAVINDHTTVGSKILAGSVSTAIQLAEIVALNHHERWDGTGYPAGRRGADIPLAARIVSVADVYDALTNARMYKPAWPKEDGVTFIVSGRGSQFDPDVVEAFRTVISRPS